MLWQHEQHSYHLKGIFVDDQLSLDHLAATLNPRAWALDLEMACYCATRIVCCANVLQRGARQYFATHPSPDPFQSWNSYRIIRMR